MIFVSETNLDFDKLRNFNGYTLFADIEKKTCMFAGTKNIEEMMKNIESIDRKIRMLDRLARQMFNTSAPVHLNTGANISPPMQHTNTPTPSGI